MKKIILPATSVFVFIGFFCSLNIHAQGVYKLWGTTQAGGRNDMGVIFSTSYAGDNLQRRYEFTVTNPGASPTDDLVEYNGKFYGMTNSGGDNNAGVIFEWDTAGNIYTKKFDFSPANGRISQGSLTLKGNKFYGVTSQGGAFDGGVIFEWDPLSNVYTKKIDFHNNGYYPIQGLTLYGDKFYGTTTFGGKNDNGVIFEWDPATNVYIKKHDFSADNLDGRDAFASLSVSGNKLYGTTIFGGRYDKGVIFEWDPVSNVYTRKKDFNGTDGAGPQSALTLINKKFYGMTISGGSTNEGVIFEWDPVTNVYAKKIDLNTSKGRYPNGHLTYNAGKFYGMTNLGGSNDQGVIFEWDPASNLYTKKIDLSAANGSEPLADLTFLENKFYGMTWKGGSNGHGVIFQWDPATNIYAKKISLDYSPGNEPVQKLIYSNGKFYGATQLGGDSDAGVLYEWNPATSKFTKKIDLSSIGGNSFNGDLVLYNGKFYGVTSGGGNYGGGVIFEWDTINNVYTKKFDFNSATGSDPINLTLYNGKFFGTTSSGGSNGGGVLFQWDPATNMYTKKIELFHKEYDDEPSLDGEDFQGLALYNNKFYGRTASGGVNDAGVIFEYDPVSNVYTKKHDFARLNGASLYAGTFTLSGGKFYATMFVGGSNGSGFIFEWNPATNAYAEKFDFSSANGTAPFGSLLSSSDKLYGMTSTGGIYDKGVLFEYDPIKNKYTKKKDFNGANGGYPIENELTLAPSPVANGAPGSCVNFPSVIIDSSNNNKWVPVVDTLGDAVAEIKANGNNLGIVSSSLFINSATVREDAYHRLYLDRNITLTPQFKPASAVDIRLYIKNSEYLALKNASNANGQQFGIDSIINVGLFKNNDGCSPAVQGKLTSVVSVAGTWQSDYVFSASIDSFSSFYFANKVSGIPVSPIVTLTAPANNATYTAPATITLNATASDADGTITSVQFYNGSTLLAADSTSPYSYTINNLTAGNYSFVAKATDNNGLVSNSATVAVSVSASPDKAPVISITNPVTNETFISPATITINAAAGDSDGTIAFVKFYSGSTLLATDSSSPYSYKLNAPAGNYKFYATATDNNGKVSSTASVSVFVVNGTSSKAPAVNITTPANNAGYSAHTNIAIKALASDADGSIANVKFYNGSVLLATDSVSPYSYTLNNAATGSYSFVAKATDNKGFISNSSTVAVSVGPATNKAPTVNLTGPANNASYGAPATITLHATASDPDGTITGVKFYNGSTLLAIDSSNPYSYTLQVAAAGTYKFFAKATDNNGLSNSSATVTVFVLPGTINKAPVVNITSPAGNAVYYAPASVTINAAASDADGTVKSVQFYNGSTLLATDSSSPYSYTISNLAAGSYSFVAKATDNNGLVSNSATVAVSVLASPNQAPIVNITAPASNANYVAHENITLTATASDADGTVTNVKFYNGPAFLKTVSKSPYTYTLINPAAGAYKFYAKATDNNGLANSSATVYVVVNPQSGVSCPFSAQPTFGYNFNGTFTANINNGVADSSESASVTVCDGGEYFTSGHFHSSLSTLYNITFTSTGGKIVVDGVYPPQDNVATAGELTNSAGTHMLNLVDPAIGGSFVQTITPFTDINNNGILDSGDCAGDPIVYTHTAIVCAGKSNVAINKPSNNTSLFAFAEMNLAPNPAHSILHISLKGLPQNKPSIISLMSSSGVVIKTMQTNSSTPVIQLNVFPLASGMYIVKIVSGNKIIYKQFIKM